MSICFSNVSTASAIQMGESFGKFCVDVIQAARESFLIGNGDFPGLSYEQVRLTHISSKDQSFGLKVRNMSGNELIDVCDYRVTDTRPPICTQNTLMFIPGNTTVTYGTPTFQGQIIPFIDTDDEAVVFQNSTIYPSEVFFVLGFQNFMNKYCTENKTFLNDTSSMLHTIRTIYIYIHEVVQYLSNEDSN